MAGPALPEAETRAFAAPHLVAAAAARALAAEKQAQKEAQQSKAPAAGLHRTQASYPAESEDALKSQVSLICFPQHVLVRLLPSMTRSD